MTETELHLGQLQQNIAHLAGISEEGWVMHWGDSDQTAFEIVCRKASALQVEKLDSLISNAHCKAVTQLK